MIKAIQTQYKGYNFRSRLEARWAVFFDALNIEWLYEPQGFDLGSKGWYLPDFYFPAWHTYTEVKPEIPTRAEFAKIHALSAAQEVRENNRRTEYTMLCGSPGLPKLILDERGISVGDGYAALTTAGYSPEGRPYAIISCFAMVAGGKELDIWPIYFTCEKGFFCFPATIEPIDIHGNNPNLYGMTLFHGPHRRLYSGPGVKYKTSNLMLAYTAARSARFEHGEKPQ